MKKNERYWYTIEKKEPINSKQIKDGFDPLATHILNQDSVLTP